MVNQQQQQINTYYARLRISQTEPELECFFIIIFQDVKYNIQISFMKKIMPSKYFTLAFGQYDTSVNPSVMMNVLITLFVTPVG